MGVEMELKQVDDSGAFLTDGRLEMSAAEQYEFDRNGYLVLRDFMTPEQTEALKYATEKLEAHANAQLPPGNGGMPLPPHKRAPWGGTYHFDEELGYHCNHVGEVDGNGANGGASTIIEDYFNADPAFDVLIDHPKTMAYINTIIQDRATINNSEIVPATAMRLVRRRPQEVRVTSSSSDDAMRTARVRPKPRGRRVA